MLQVTLSDTVYTFKMLPFDGSNFTYNYALHILLAQPLFWVYDQGKIVKCLEGDKNPEFYEPTQNPFFIVPTGSQTMNGDSTLAGIRGLLQAKGVYCWYALYLNFHMIHRTS